jgi:hypothetical protein
MLDHAPNVGGPGAMDKFYPEDLDEVRERVLLPVVTKLIQPDVLERAEVGWGPSLSKEYIPQLAMGAQGQLCDYGHDLFVYISAAGNSLHWQIWQPDLAWRFESLQDVVFDLAMRVEQWALERLGVDVSPTIEYVIPVR